MDYQSCYILCAVFVVYRATDAFETKFNLLQPPADKADLVGESYNGDTYSTRFVTKTGVEVKDTDTGLLGTKLAPPFIVTAIFKMFHGKSSCLFSINQNNSIVLNLCLRPADKSVSRLSLTSDLFTPKDSVYFLFNDNFVDKWIKIVVYVKDNSALLLVNCSQQPEKFGLVRNSEHNEFLLDNINIKLAYPAESRNQFKVITILLYEPDQTTADKKFAVCGDSNPRT
ncbi:hypothetical protein B5X24_HaOG210670 [Helicoverpa armigera]|nr:hypothetical protein B5X24_HaOG210670 [Helicoverpa armigera]